MARGLKKERLAFFRYYKEQTGEKEIDLKKVVAFAKQKGWKIPEPIDGETQLAKQFAEALREETRVNKKTGRPYRANHVYTRQQGTTQLHLWIDIDEAKRGPMHKALQMRREQVVGDVVSISDDEDHWNSINPKEEPIKLEFDFNPDVQWRKASPGDQQLAS